LHGKCPARGARDVAFGMNAERAFFTHVPSMLRVGTVLRTGSIIALCSLQIDCGESIRSYHRAVLWLESARREREQLVLRIASAKLGASWDSRRGQSGITAVEAGAALSRCAPSDPRS
jgi:hypothetical protein